jgi:hypothetical protein
MGELPGIEKILKYESSIEFILCKAWTNDYALLIECSTGML